jgi:hypothetical protein
MACVGKSGRFSSILCIHTLACDHNRKPISVHDWILEFAFHIVAIDNTGRSPTSMELVGFQIGLRSPIPPRVFNNVARRQILFRKPVRYPVATTFYIAYLLCYFELNLVRTCSLVIIVRQYCVILVR